MKLRLILVLFLIGALLPSLMAQKTPEIEISDPEAIQLLDKVSKKLEQSYNYRVDFTFTVDYPGEDSIVSKGHMIQEGEKYLVDLQDQSFTCDGKSVWVHMIPQKEVQITDVEESSDGFNNPSDFLSIYEKEEFIFGILSAYHNERDKIKEIEFKPTDTNSEFFKVRIILNASRLRIDEVIVFYKNGSQFRLQVNQWQTNVETTATLFQFDASKFPDVHIEDLRF
ncbi:MAG: outer membrane lipoprotein carrier protein LolA [Bacteroidia bacterium]|nr:outer membrane lipoprotein carrier protein LolA [Bacteroidia bacterium]